MTLSRKTTHAPTMEAGSSDDDWKQWFERHGPKLLLCARQWTRTLADAEDVVQEVFARYWRHQRWLAGEPLALLVTSIRRAACDLARRDERRSRREAQTEVMLGEGDGRMFETPFEGEERRAAIERALRAIPAEQREVLVLRVWGELTFAEIAEQLDVPANTVASRYRYALVALRERLKASDTECHGR